MDLECILNFTEICRCCKATESGMTSIFDGNAHSTDHTYPPVKEMLRSIASLNVQENDGLPSLVCTSCLNNIQDAFTFILQLIQVDEELSLILATGKQDENTLHSDFVKNENEDVNHLLKVEDLDEPMLNFYQHGSAVSSYENINSVVKLEQLDQDAARNVDEPEAAVESEEVSNLADPLYHASDEEKDILVKEYTYTVNDDDFLMVQKSEEMEVCEDMDDFGVDEDYQADVQEGNSPDSSDDTDEVQADGDYQEKNEDGNSVDSSDSCRKLRTVQQKTNLVDAPLFRCKLCAYSNPNMSNLKMHLQTHFDLEPFICSKCNGTFTRRTSMLRHWRKCNGKMNAYAVNARHGQHRRMKLRRMRAMTRQEFEDPEKRKEFHTAVQQNNDGAADDNDDVKMQEAIDAAGEAETSSEPTVFRCKLCTFTHKHMSSLKVHLYTHFKENKQFVCSKCKLTFARHSYMQHHWRSCNGEISIHALSARRARQARNGGNGSGPKRVLGLIIQDLEDPEKLRQLYTVDGVDCLKQIFTCKLCAFTNRSISNIKRHLQFHIDSTFTCSKCYCTFARKTNMLTHWRKCNGEISKFALNACHVQDRKTVLKRMRALTRHEFEDPEKIKEFYTAVQQNNDDGAADDNDDVEMQEAKDSGGEAETSEPTVFRCKLCSFTHKHMSSFKVHLYTHFNEDKVFACSKCKLTFARHSYMQHHWRRCNGEVSMSALIGRARNGSGPKRVLGLILQDLEDPEKMRQLYTVNRVDTSKQIFKCKLCTYTNAQLYLLKYHLVTHSNDRSFACSKCTLPFKRKCDMLRHWRKCNGEVSKRALSRRQVRSNGKKQKQVALTQQELQDPEKVKELYTEIDLQNNSGYN